MFWSCGSGRGDFALEFLHSSGGVYYFFLAGIKWMTGIANFHAYFFQRGADFKMIAAGALNGGLIILWMDTCFHEGYVTMETSICKPLDRYGVFAVL